MADTDRRYDATAIFNANFQIGKAAPLDNRDVVRRYAHLTTSIGLNKYLGEVVYVTGEYDAQADAQIDGQTNPVVVNGIVESEVGFYYYKNDTDGWVKTLTIENGGSGGGSSSEIPVEALPVGEPNGVVPLDENALIPAEYLPSYIDEIVEGYYNPTDGKFYDTYESQTYSGEITGEAGKIYVDLLTEKTFRYSGETGNLFVEISNSQVTRSFTTNIQVGGIAKGTQIDTTKSLEDVLRMILVNVYNPTVTTQASASISRKSGSSVIEIGTKDISYTYTVTGNRGIVKLDGVTQGEYAGAMSKFALKMNDTEVKSVSSSTSPQDISINVTAVGNFNDGTNDIVISGETMSTSTEQIITFKGSVTFANGTHYNDSTGQPSQAFTPFSAQELTSSGSTVEIVCPIYGNTNVSTPGTTIKQNPIAKTTIKSGVQLTLAKHKLVESGGNIDWSNSTPYTFEIPAAWTLSKVEWYDSVADKWKDQTSSFILKQTANKTINGVTVSYKTYYYNVISDNIDENIYKIYIA